MKNTQCILIIGSVWLEPDSSAAGSRMMQLIGLFQEQGWTVVFASSAMDSNYMTDIEALGIIKKTIVLNCNSFDVFIRELNPSMVLFDRFMIEEQYGWRVAENCPSALRILDTEDLHCLRLARQKAVKEDRIFSVTDLFSDTAKREIASILRCDISLIISEMEMQLLQEQFKVDQALLYYLPFLLNAMPADTIKKLPTFESRKNFIFIGNFLHEPNWDTVQYLKNVIWPELRKKVPEAALHIYGGYPSQKVLQLHQPKEQFHIMGRAEDAQQVVRNARVVLAPIRFGAGIKGKLTEAMQCGTPSVTTIVGAESMYGKFPWNGTIVDDPYLFVEAAAQLYTNKKEWVQAQQNGFTIIENRYLKTLYAVAFIRHLLDIQNNLERHRLNNFMGALLQHHTLNSTKYMSRWIEAKNRIITIILFLSLLF